MKSRSKTLFRRTAKGMPGFSLIEVLIALIIMSVGMLGIASLYVHGMQAGRTSMFRHNAVTLAGDIADRIRANPGAGDAYEAAVPGAAVDCLSTDCDAATMASSDIFTWNAQADVSLPTGHTITVTHNDGVTPPTYTIAISWPEPGIKPGDPNPNYTIIIPVLDI